MQMISTVFVFLYTTYCTKHNTLQVHTCCWKWQSFTLLWLSTVLHRIYMPHLLYSFICWWPHHPEHTRPRQILFLIFIMKVNEPTQWWTEEHNEPIWTHHPAPMLSTCDHSCSIDCLISFFLLLYYFQISTTYYIPHELTFDAQDRQ